jgi:hypothetical protein
MQPPTEITCYVRVMNLFCDLLRLAGRYATPLPKLADEVAFLSARVNDKRSG